jgi:hypothetical protein
MSIFEFDSNPLIFESRFYVTGLFNNYLPLICKFQNIHDTLNVFNFAFSLASITGLQKLNSFFTLMKKEKGLRNAMVYWLAGKAKSGVLPY